MKGDFSRLTFRPRRQYTRVLQQQGRPHLDADWNEQAAILLHQMRMVTGDIIGNELFRAGAPIGVDGFEINELPGEGDNFSISRGRYYIDGLCCVCDEDTTYRDQPLVPAERIDRNGILLVYLDAWETVVTPLDDPILLEPALSGIETTLRARVAWQVRTHRLRRHHDIRDPDFDALRQEVHDVHGNWHAHQRGMLRMRLTGRPREGRRHRPDTGEQRGHFRGPENLLYRVEVHYGGPLGQATFKWSRDNGAPLLPLLSLDGAVAQVVPSARQALSLLKPDDWMEISTSADRASGRVRDMVRVVRTDLGYGRLQLSEAPMPQGFTQGQQTDVALRRWDQSNNASAQAVQIVEGTHEAHWVDLEDGIQIQFQSGENGGHMYRSGDYWLLPARTADEGLLLRSASPQPPDGVDHVTAPLALFVPQLALAIGDYRPPFLPMAALLQQVNAMSDRIDDLEQQIAALKER